MSNRMSEEARTIYTERRTSDRERTMNRHAERNSKRGARVSFGGAY